MVTVSTRFTEKNTDKGGAWMKYKTAQKLKKHGLNNMDIAMIKESARKAAEEAQKQAMEQAFMLMIWIPINVLAADYWEKTANKRIPEFTDKVASLYESVQSGTTTWEQIAEDIKRLSGMDITSDWLKRKEG